MLFVFSCSYIGDAYHFRGNVTLTCAYNTLKEIDSINKVWIYYDGLPHFPIISRSHLKRRDGIGFVGEGFSGDITVGTSIGYVHVYSGPRVGEYAPKLKLQMQKTIEKIKESLYDNCHATPYWD